METTNEAMVELCQQLTEMKQEEGKNITKLISRIEELTKLSELDRPRAPQ